MNVLGLTPRAIADFTAGIVYDESYIPAYESRALAYYLNGNDDLAIADYSWLIGAKKDDPEAYEWRGGLYLKKGEKQKATADFQAVLRLNPNSAKAKEQLSTLAPQSDTDFIKIGNDQRNKGKTDDAMSSFSEAMSQRIWKASSRFPETRYLPSGEIAILVIHPLWSYLWRSSPLATAHRLTRSSAYPAIHLLSADQASVLAPPILPTSLRSSSPVFASQIRIPAPSPEAATSFPSGDSAAQATLAMPLNSGSWRPVAVSQRTTRRSSAPSATAPSGESDRPKSLSPWRNLTEPNRAIAPVGSGSPLRSERGCAFADDGADPDNTRAVKTAEIERMCGYL